MNQNHIFSNAWPSYIDPANGLDLVYYADDSQKYLQAPGGQKYSVINDIQRLLESLDNYATAFGEQWMRWRSTQLDSFTGTTITRDRMYRCLGSAGLELLKNSNRPVQVLEVGCGAGRFTEILLEFPSVRLTSMDLSQAVDANALNFPQDTRHRIVQADVMCTPFAPQQFDMVICLGVVQHTPIPGATIQKLFEQVKPGGYLIFDHYTFEIRRSTKITGNLLRPFIKRLPSGARMRVVQVLITIFFPIHKAIRNIPFAQQLFSRISPITTYYHAYPQLPEQLQREWSILDTHDGMTDWYKYLRSVDQLRASLMDNGAKEVQALCGGMGVEVICRRQA